MKNLDEFMFKQCFEVKFDSNEVKHTHSNEVKHTKNALYLVRVVAPIVKMLSVPTVPDAQ